MRFEVSFKPSLPASGESFTMNIIEITGGSIGGAYTPNDVIVTNNDVIIRETQKKSALLKRFFMMTSSIHFEALLP